MSSIATVVSSVFLMLGVQASLADNVPMNSTVGNAAANEVTAPAEKSNAEQSAAIKVDNSETAKGVIPTVVENSSPEFRPLEITTPTSNQPNNIYEENRLNTIHYRVPRKKYFATLGLESPIQDIKQDVNAYGKPTSDRTYSFFQANGSVAYGLTNRFSIGLSESYLFEKTESRVNSNMGSNGFKFKGFSDPLVTANWQILGELHGQSFAEIFVTLSPKTGNQTTAYTFIEGNNLSGESAATIGANYVRVLGKNELLLSPYLTYLWVAQEDHYLNVPETYLPTVLWGVTTEYRYHFNPGFYVDINILWRSHYSRDYNYNNDPYGTTSYAFDIQPTFSFGWIVSDKSSVSVSYFVDSSRSDSTLFYRDNTAGNDSSSTWVKQYLTTSYSKEF